MQRVVFFCPDTIGERMAGTGLRFWELAHALARHGFEVTLATPAAAERTSADVRLAVHGFEDLACARLAAAAGVIVVQGFMTFHAPALLHAGRPMAVDLCVPLLVENLVNRQDDAPEARTRDYLANVQVQRDQLRRGDFFFCAGERQRDYWLGSLVALGRVSAQAHAGDRTLRRLIDVVPFGLPARAPQRTHTVLKGVLPGIAPDDLVLLWGGGVWGWFDPLTPIRGLARALETRSDLKLFFMGRGHPNPRLEAVAHAPVYDAAVALARELGLLGTHVFFNDGWTPYDERENYLLEADLGVSAHRDHVETALAVRTRLFDYIWAGLPMLVTGGDGVSEELVAPAGLGRVVPPEDERAWCDALLALAAEPDRRAARAAAFERVRQALTWDRVVEPLARFCERAA
jgi:glycosyltransferase involved in cell wall biosynthesis